MTESPELLGLAIAVFGVALAVLASTILWRHQSVRLRRVVAGLLVTAAVLLYAYMPELAYNYQPAPVPASALVYTLMSLGQSANPSSTAQPNTVTALSARSGATVWRRAFPVAYC